MIVKNIALAGHAGTGKTTLMETLLFIGGRTERIGNTQAGNTVSDYTAEEIRQQASVYTAVANYTKNGQKINLIDTPGMFDYAGGMVQGVAAADCVLITVSGKAGIQVGAKKAFRAAEGKMRMFVVTRMDDEANFDKVLTDLKTEFGSAVCPVVVPVVVDHKVDSYVNLMEMKAYRYEKNGKKQEVDLPDNAEDLAAEFSETVAETDEELLEKFFSGEEFTQEERISGVRIGMKTGAIIPVVCISATKMEGVDMLMDAIESWIPEQAPTDEIAAKNADGEQVLLHPVAGEPVCVQVFQTLADPFVGKLSMLRVISGTLKAGAELVNASKGGTEKIGKLAFQCGKRQTDTAEVQTGDLAAATKLSVSTGDTLCDASRVVTLPRFTYPRPCYPMAIQPATRGNESKIASALQKILEEDQTLSYAQNPLTKEMTLTGLGEQHLSVITARLKNDFGVDVVLSVPKVAYRETIRKKVKVQGKHKKQSGGHGQYGDVWIEFEPCDSEDLVFEERVFGGAVPRNYFPAVEKGLQESVAKGVLAGFPVVGVKAVLVDGSYHPVDSSEMAFKTAASIAYREGMRQASPTLLEPIGVLRVTVPDSQTGDIMGDLNKRRGRVMGMSVAEGEKGMTTIEAEVPMREMSDFALSLRQMTQGEGTFSLEPARYEQLPSNLVDEVIAAAAD